MTNRPDVPSDVKRQLRQEAGFGCCFCGHPFIAYHHIIPYAEDQHFRPSDMMVVCDNCHRACTNGAIPQNDQRQAKARSRNIADGALRGQLFVTSNKLTVELAGGLAVNTPRLLDYRGMSILAAHLSDDGRVLIDAIVQNSAGRVIAQLHKNEWTGLVSEIWDFECSHRWATVRSGPYDVSFAIDCRDDRLCMQGKWSLGVSKFEFSPSRCRFGNNDLNGFHVEDCGGFLSLG